MGYSSDQGDTSSGEKEKKSQGCYITMAISSLIIIGLARVFCPGTIPFKFFEFWYLKGSVSELLRFCWPLFAWGIGINVVVVLKGRNDPEMNRNAENILAVGTAVSIFAGIIEEIAFRWLIFYGQIVSYKITNYLFFGFAGFGISEWIFTHISGPIANFFTLGLMGDIIFNKLGWFVGAAILSSNGQFKQGHEYQGWLGAINSWFIGMFFFYLMFNYGLIAAIIVHFFYDLFIFGVHYVDAAIERQLGWC